jgi:hypothetical protein
MVLPPLGLDVKAFSPIIPHFQQFVKGYPAIFPSKSDIPNLHKRFAKVSADVT